MKATSICVLLVLPTTLQAFNLFENIFEAQIVDSGNKIKNDVHEFVDGTFSWSRCNASVVPIAVTLLSVQPDPIQFGKNVTISVAVDVTEDIGTQDQNVKVDMKVMMKMGPEYYDVCVYKEEYCHFDLCQMAAKYKYNCPFPKYKYSLKNITYYLPIQKITVTGAFDITIQLSSKGRELGCINIQLCLGQCD
ncbi:ganglioside GM2 activator-like [Dreissena polymorpha]|uniref:MD-2-related lipid-recognition domain-containing protein n=1 Tax=Dreissena polymorpha TaxID=45954 RepID=A0A9D4K7W2_DREPO|nr:ganglioside GM2 activator-like [Dreissena polymorpha]KAH3834713.1 hypothetical protein DPMN_108048 [Dreissena polymorpha]